MTTVTRWSNPVRNLAALEVDRLNRMFDNFFGEEPMVRGGWVPPVDISETADGEVVLKAELPDMKRDDIKVTLENSVLTIEGERKFAGEQSSDKYHRVERAYGSFRRSFTLPPTLDASRVDASYQDGVLTVKVPQRPEAKPRQIAING